MAKSAKQSVASTVLSEGLDNTIPEEETVTEQQQAILGSVSEVETAPWVENVSEENIPEPIPETVSENVPYTDEEIAQLKAEANSEEKGSDVFADDMYRDCFNGRLTKEQYKDIMGVSFEDAIPPTAKAESGHNKPENINPMIEDVKEKLQHYTPHDATNSAEAVENVKLALDKTIEHQDDGETNLASQGAIAIADYLVFNAGLREDGNNAVTVNPSLYDSTVKKLMDLVDEDTAKDGTFKATVGQMAKRAILMMVGKLETGWFVVPQGKKSVTQAMAAYPLYPSPENVPEGAKVKRAVVIKENLLMPRIPTIKKTTGEVTGYTANDCEDLRKATNGPVQALYASLWDGDGELEYDANGIISGFLSGAKVQERTRQAEKLAREKAEREAAEKEALNNPQTELRKRETGGAVDEPSQEETTKELLKARMEQAQKDARAAVEANKGGILSAMRGFGAFLRDTSQPLDPESRVEALHNCVVLLARRIIAPAIKPTPEDMKELVSIHKHMLNHMFWDNDKGVWQWKDIDNVPVATYVETKEDYAAA